MVLQVESVIDETEEAMIASRSKKKRGNNSHSTEKVRQSRRLFFLISPFLILVLLFCYYPLFGWVYAFFDYQPPIPLSQSKFVGFKWFWLLISNPEQLNQLRQVLTNTFAMSGLGIICSFLPVFVAIGLNEIRQRRTRSIIQTLTTLPNFISWVLVYAIAFAFFSADGMVNTLLHNLGLITEPLRFLDSDSFVWLKMMLWQLWKGLGWGAILYLAAIAGIDQELYEAASVDGANRFQQIRHVTIPAVIPTYFVLLLLEISNILNNGMEQYYVFQNAFNVNFIQVLDLYVYNVGMTHNSLSVATVMSMLKSLVSIALLFTVNAIAKKTRGQSIV